MDLQRDEFGLVAVVVVFGHWRSPGHTRAA
jgi:hypothetical protein